MTAMATKAESTRVALVIFLLLVAPWVVPTSWLLVLENALVLALFAAATNLLVGWTGLVSFGQAAFYGIGAYTVALAWLHGIAPFWLAFIAAPLIAGLVAFVTGAIALRARKLYFALLTLAFSELFNVLAEQLYDITNGANGIFGAMVPDLLVIPRPGFYFTLAVVIAALTLLYRIAHSPFGLALRAIRERRVRAEALGLAVSLHELAAFTISGAFCGLAGALYVVHDQTAYPELLNWVKSGEPVIVAVIGGISSFAGPLWGALFYQIAHDTLVALTRDWQMALGALLLLVVLFRPGGIVSFFGGREHRSK
jgi:branched-chain amino acid transport system permease protein